jgi:hypothetical protein
LIDVLIRYFSKTEVSSVMRIETQRLKIKVSKTQGPKMYLTQILNLKISFFLLLWAMHRLVSKINFYDSFVCGIDHWNRITISMK